MENPALPSRLPSGTAPSVLRRSGRRLRIVLEIVLLSLLMITTRCANFSDVFVQGKIYFVDADCYARMTRARLVMPHPGLVVRRHDFENYPVGVNPHTTAPLDYLIVLFAFALRPITAQPLDLAGALISPLLALLAGWFLWWWSRRLPWPGRYLMLLVYALSAILAHGTALGRPDQQSLLIALILVALAAEGRLQEEPTRRWAVVSGLSWGLALWVSLYEPLILLGALLAVLAFARRDRWWAGERGIGWGILLGVLLGAAVVERRWPAWPLASPSFARWSTTIGELQPVGLTNPAWLYWASGLLLVSPFLVWTARRRRALDRVFVIWLVLSLILTFWQARWGCYFALVFLLTIPAQCAVVRAKGGAVAVALAALFPLLQFWDARFWPNDAGAQSQAAARRAAVQWRTVATSLAGTERTPIMAPWWLSPAVAYWSGQPTVAGSSHESLPGIVDSAIFYLSATPKEAAQILRRHEVRWILLGDEDEVGMNSAVILGVGIPENALCRELARSSAPASPWLVFRGRNGPVLLCEATGLPQKSRRLQPLVR